MNWQISLRVKALANTLFCFFMPKFYVCLVNRKQDPLHSRTTYLYAPFVLNQYIHNISHMARTLSSWTKLVGSAHSHCLAGVHTKRSSSNVWLELSPFLSSLSGWKFFCMGFFGKKSPKSRYWPKKNISSLDYSCFYFFHL